MLNNQLHIPELDKKLRETSMESLAVSTEILEVHSVIVTQEQMCTRQTFYTGRDINTYR